MKNEMNEIPTPETNAFMLEYNRAIAAQKTRPSMWDKLQSLERRLTVAREALESMLPPGDGSYSSDWWCPSCRELKDGGRVTNSEHCEDCGTFLTPHQNGEAQSARIREALTLTAPKQ